MDLEETQGEREEREEHKRAGVRRAEPETLGSFRQGWGLLSPRGGGTISVSELLKGEELLIETDFTLQTLFELTLKEALWEKKILAFRFVRNASLL